MKRIEGGFILLSRNMLSSELMDRPSLWLKLFVWILLKATHKPYKGLERGELHTTIEAMQEAMAHYIGFRKITPSKDQIRKSYESLVRSTMITTQRTTRGIRITICNYERYQNPENYETHCETLNESGTKAERVPPGIQEHNKKEDKETPDSLFESGSDSLEPPGPAPDPEPVYIAKGGAELRGRFLEWFKAFWVAFHWPKDKAAAAAIFLKYCKKGIINTRNIQAVIEAARWEAANRPALQQRNEKPKWAEGWISGKRWEEYEAIKKQRTARTGTEETEEDREYKKWFEDKYEENFGNKKGKKACTEN